MSIQVHALQHSPTDVGLRSPAEEQQGPPKGQGPTYAESGSKVKNDHNSRKRDSGNVNHGHIRHSHQPYAPATKLKSSDYHPRFCAEFPGDICSYSPVPCGRPAYPPNCPTYGKPNRTFQENGSGWPRYRVNSLNDRERLQRICIPPKQHPAGIPGWDILPKYVKPRLQYGKNVGDILPRLSLRQTDVIIRPCIDRNNVLRAGYVAFLKNNELVELEAGTMLLRVAKSLSGEFRMRECIQLFLRTVDGCWRFKGLLNTHNVYNKTCTPSNYLKIPVRYQRTKDPNTADDHFIPQRGDIIIHEPWKDLTHTDRADKCSSLRWWLPTLEIDLNDVLVRMCVWVNGPECTRFDGFVDLFMFNGIGLGWIFLGRDETDFQVMGLPPESETSDDDNLNE